jgi:hypothetical protein
MIRLRFVQEYRGRRIVTNGRLYGIQGELITDCRYLDVNGARAAINSEAGIEERRKYLEWRERVCPNVEYFSDYKTRDFKCECGWRGRHGELVEKTFGTVGWYCPTCGRGLLYVVFPSDDEIKKAAADGNPEARAMVPEVLDREHKEKEWMRQALTKRSQLPALDGDALEFVWDLVTEGGDNYYVLTVGSQLVWRERARVEDWERFNQVKQLLKKKYGRFARLMLTDTAEANLRGGYWGAKFNPT